MAEQPVNLPTAIYLGVFSRAEQRVPWLVGGHRCNWAAHGHCGQISILMSKLEQLTPNAALRGILLDGPVTVSVWGCYWHDAPAW